MESTTFNLESVLEDFSIPRSALATEVSSTLSEKYVRIDSRKVIETMYGEGYILADARGTISEFGRHVLDFRRPDDEAELKLGGEAVPRVMFTNSHDGSSTARFAVGVFRLICSNGMTVGSTYAQERVRHIGDDARALLDRIAAIAKATTPMINQIDQWRRLVMSQSNQMEFAKRVAELRFANPNRFSYEAIIRPRRDEDVGDSLWSVFNRAQENTVQGGIAGLSADGRSITSRPISSAIRDFEYNQQLWKLAEEFAEA